MKTRRVAVGPMSKVSVRWILCLAFFYLFLFFSPFLVHFSANRSLDSLFPSSFSSMYVASHLFRYLGPYLALLIAMVQVCGYAAFPLRAFFKQKLTQQDKQWFAFYPVLWGAISFCLFPRILWANDPGVFLNGAFGRWMVSCDDWRILFFHNASYLFPLLIVAPVIQELFFRGLLIHRLSVKYGRPAGLIASALIFGLFSGANVLAGVMMGIALGVLYLRTGSLWLVILLHMMHNAMSMALDVLIAYNHVDFQGAFTFGLFWLIGGACFWAVVWGMFRHKLLFMIYPPFLKPYTAGPNQSGKV